MKINKRFIQFLACILILIFHLWIIVTGSNIENFIIKTAYIGVDMFFLVSAYSLADKKLEYKSFVLNRFINIYLKYIIFALIFFIYKKIKFIRFIKIILGIELFERGGGAFLWFIPAIMIFYLVYPLFINWKNKYKGLIVLVIYLIVGICLSNFTNYRSLFIFINRIPVLLLGYYLKVKELKYNEYFNYLFIIIGIILLYLFGYKNRLNYPIKEIFYVTSIVLIIGILYLSNKVKNGLIINTVGSISLEVYAVQMIFGYDLAAKLLNLINIKLLVNILVIISVLIIAYIFNQLFNLILKKNK